MAKERMGTRARLLSVDLSLSARVTRVRKRLLMTEKIEMELVCYEPGQGTHRHRRCRHRTRHPLHRPTISRSRIGKFPQQTRLSNTGIAADHNTSRQRPIKNPTEVAQHRSAPHQRPRHG